jgi:O-antigen biosynthesis protein WbqP
MKRSFDVLVAAVGLLASLPVILVLVAAIRLDSRGNALFFQKRVGQDGRIFTCCKLRTMSTGTTDVPTHMADGSQVTKVGAFLRRTKLDELPQLWNILRGEMSFVGPRPCLPSQVELIEERRKRGVLALLPGITGVAQVEGIDMSDPVRLAEKDAEYLRTASFSGDMGLIWRTLFKGEGQGDRVNYR